MRTMIGRFGVWAGCLLGWSGWAGADATEDTEVVLESDRDFEDEPFSGSELEAANDRLREGLFLGAGLGVGQSQATRGASSADVAFHLHLEPGYLMHRDPWNVLQLSTEVFFGRGGYRDGSKRNLKVQVPVGLGMLLKVGYGYAIGDGLYSLWTLGVGPASVKYSGDADGGITVSAGPTLGLVVRFGAGVLVEVADSLLLDGGLRLTHLAFDVNNPAVTGIAASELGVEGPVNLNMTEAYLGLRWVL